MQNQSEKSLAPLAARVDTLFADSIRSITLARGVLSEVIGTAAASLAAALENDGKILICGNGGSASDSLHFSSELLNKFNRLRRPLAGLSLACDVATLTSISNDESYDAVFAKQVQALGKPSDRLVVITTSGNSPSILQAVQAAHDKQMVCIALNGKGGGLLSPLLHEGDIDIVVPSDSTANIQEIHGIIIHAFCELIDDQILGENKI